MPVSKKQLSANRQNAQKSTGPKTPEGKAAVARGLLSPIHIRKPDKKRISIIKNKPISLHYAERHKLTASIPGNRIINHSRICQKTAVRNGFLTGEWDGFPIRSGMTRERGTGRKNTHSKMKNKPIFSHYHNRHALTAKHFRRFRGGPVLLRRVLISGADFALPEIVTRRSFRRQVTIPPIK